MTEFGVFKPTGAHEAADQHHRRSVVNWPLIAALSGNVAAWMVLAALAGLVPR